MFGLGQQGYGNQPSFLSNPNQPVKILSSINPTFCLDSSQDHSELNKLIIYHQNNGPNQKWRILSDGMGNYGFSSLQNGGTLQIPPQSNGKEGTNCIVGPPIGNPNQKWQIIPEGNFFVIRSAINPNLCLDIDGQLLYNENSVIVWIHSPNKKNQLWSIVPA